MDFSVGLRMDISAAFSLAQGWEKSFELAYLKLCKEYGKAFQLFWQTLRKHQICRSHFIRKSINQNQVPIHDKGWGTRHMHLKWSNRVTVNTCSAQTLVFSTALKFCQEISNLVFHQTFIISAAHWSGEGDIFLLYLLNTVALRYMCVCVCMHAHKAFHCMNLHLHHVRHKFTAWEPDLRYRQLEFQIQNHPWHMHRKFMISPAYYG